MIANNTKVSKEPKHMYDYFFIKFVARIILHMVILSYCVTTNNYFGKCISRKLIQNVFHKWLSDSNIVFEKVLIFY